jgi:LysR family transcriptional regulator for bpeEF and oprC
LLDGSLVAVLPDAPLRALPISLVYPKGRMATAKLRVFADWLMQLLDQDADVRLTA